MAVAVAPYSSSPSDRSRFRKMVMTCPGAGKPVSRQWPLDMTSAGAVSGVRITPLPSAHDAPDTESAYQPARPLNRIYLLDFKTLNENFGEDPVGDTLEQIDPILLRYKTAFASLGQPDLFQKNLEQLIEEFAFDVSHPPFALGASTRAASRQ